MDEQIAISRIRQADLTGLKSLVKRYQARAVHAAYLILYDRALAEDIAQAAFLKVTERIHQFDERHPFAPWFFRIVVNETAKQRRQNSRSRKNGEGQRRSLPSFLLFAR